MNAPLPNPIRPAFVTPEREDRVIVSIGPSHPATHGTVQIIAELDGERIVRTDVHVGYLHRGFEKECESHTWHNLIPYVDRLNYCSALINDFAYCEAVERMMEVEITPTSRMRSMKMRLRSTRPWTRAMKTSYLSRISPRRASQPSGRSRASPPMRP